MRMVLQQIRTFELLSAVLSDWQVLPFQQKHMKIHTATSITPFSF